MKRDDNTLIEKQVIIQMKICITGEQKENNNLDILFKVSDQQKKTEKLAKTTRNVN